MTGEELRALRLRLGLNPTQMAERLGLGWRMYRYIEKGEHQLSKASAMLAARLLEELPPSD